MTFPVEINEGETVIDLKKKISERSGLLVHKLKLIHNGVSIEDNSRPATEIASGTLYVVQ